ncbi:MAG: helix-turn-helix domain-containing protein [Verrucomicrobiota bacterium]
MTQLRWKDFTRPGDAYHLGRAILKGNCRPDYHDHDYVEIFWINHGEATHLINDQRHSLSPGDYAFIRAADRHTFEFKGRTHIDITNLAFPISAANALRDRYFPKERKWFWAETSLPETGRLTQAQLNDFSRRSESLAQSPHTELIRDAFLLPLFRDLLQAENNPYPAPLPDWLAAACHSLQRKENFSQPVKRFYALAGRSPEHVTRTLKRCLSQTPSQFLNATRLEYAAYQLRMSSRPVLDICYDCGYSNVGYFYQRFKERYQVSPKRYRAQQTTPLG